MRLLRIIPSAPGGVLVDEYIVAFIRYANFDGLHRGENRTTAAFFRNAVIAQDGELTLGGGAAVASHGRDDKRFTAVALDKGNQFFGNKRAVGDAAAAAGDAKPHAGFDERIRFFPAQVAHEWQQGGR